jgi:hypothetical protein
MMDNLPPAPPVQVPAGHATARRHGGHAHAGGEGHGFSGEPAQSRLHIREHILREVEAMALFATESGIGVPESIMLALDRACDEAAPGATQPPQAAAESGGQFSRLAEVHLALTRLVAPARPGTLVLLIDQKRNHVFWNRFGAVPLVREMLGLAVVSLIVMLGIALSPQVNERNMTKTLLTLQGVPLLVNELFLVSAAAVGASLTNLKRLDTYISACTYDPRYESSYWTRLVMGLISGVILSQLIYGAFLTPSGNAAATNGSPDVLTSLGQPILALVGGFSADLVYGILTHFISVIGNLFGGPAPAKAAAAIDPGAPRAVLMPPGPPPVLPHP